MAALLVSLAPGCGQHAPTGTLTIHVQGFGGHADAYTLAVLRENVSVLQRPLGLVTARLRAGRYLVMVSREFPDPSVICGERVAVVRSGARIDLRVALLGGDRCRLEIRAG